MELKDIIRTRRENLSLTLETVARNVGVSAATVSRWESGEIKNLRRDKIAKLAEVLKVSPGYLMGWEDLQGMPIPKITKKVKANGEVVTTTRYEVSIPVDTEGIKQKKAISKAILMQSLSMLLDYSGLTLLEFSARINRPLKEVERWFTGDYDGAKKHLDVIAQGFGLSSDDILTIPRYYENDPVGTGRISRRIKELLTGKDYSLSEESMKTFLELDKAMGEMSDEEMRSILDFAFFLAKKKNEDQNKKQ